MPQRWSAKVIVPRGRDIAVKAAFLFSATREGLAFAGVAFSHPDIEGFRGLPISDLHQIGLGSHASIIGLEYSTGV